MNTTRVPPIEACNMITLCNPAPIFYFGHDNAKCSIIQTILFEMYIILVHIATNIVQCEVLNFHIIWARNVEMAVSQRLMRLFALADISWYHWNSTIPYLYKTCSINPCWWCFISLYLWKETEEIFPDRQREKLQSVPYRFRFLKFCAIFVGVLT